MLTKLAGGWVFTMGGLGAGGAGCSGFDGPSAPRHRPKPCSPSIRKRCACGFPQGTAEPLRHASNKYILKNAFQIVYLVLYLVLPVKLYFR